jgi:hypothetical protein
MVRLVTSESPCLMFPQGRRPAVCLAQAEGLGNKTITNLQGQRPGHLLGDSHDASEPVLGC